MIKFFANEMLQNEMTEHTDFFVIGIEADAQNWQVSNFLNHCRSLNVPGILVTDDSIDSYTDIDGHPFNPLLHVTVCETNTKPVTDEMKRAAMDWVAATMFAETNGGTDCTAVAPAVIERGDTFQAGEWEAKPEFWEYALFGDASGEGYYARHEHAHAPMR